MRRNSDLSISSYKNDSRKFRNIITKLTPHIGLSCVDYGRNFQIDKFYLDCQKHRDFFKDSTERLHGIEYFNMPSNEYDTRPDLTTVYLKLPQENFKLSQPILYSLPSKSGVSFVNMNKIIDLRGTYNIPACIKYKR